jgi:hypothetical protein
MSRSIATALLVLIVHRASVFAANDEVNLLKPSAAISDEKEILTEALFCFVSLGEYKRPKARGKTKVWLGRGAVPGTSGGLQGRNAFQAMIQVGAAAAELRGFARVGGRTIVTEEFYDLKFSLADKSWFVSEGNGGTTTYESISSYANKLVRQKKPVTLLVPGTHSQSPRCEYK